MGSNNVALIATAVPDQILTSSSLAITGSTVITGSFGTMLYRQIAGACFVLRHYYCFVDRACEVPCLINDPDPFVYVNLKHTLTLDFCYGHQYTFYEWAGNILFQPASNGKVIFNKAGQYAFFTIHFGVQEMTDHLQLSSGGIDFAKRVRRNQAAALCIDNMPAGKEMRNTISDLLYGDVNGHFVTTSLPETQLDIRSKKLLLPFFTLSGRRRATITPIDEQEAEAIYRVKEKLLVELHHTHRLQDMAGYASLSEYKLKSGFKRIYNMSVLNFLHDVRMKKAYELIAFTELPYYEVASRVGYKSVTTFGNLFKRKMGISPRRLRNSMQTP